MLVSRNGGIFYICGKRPKYQFCPYNVMAVMMFPKATRYMPISPILPVLMTIRYEEIVLMPQQMLKYYCATFFLARPNSKMSPWCRAYPTNKTVTYVQNVFVC